MLQSHEDGSIVGAFPNFFSILFTFIFSVLSLERYGGFINGDIFPGLIRVSQKGREWEEELVFFVNIHLQPPLERGAN